MQETSEFAETTKPPAAVKELFDLPAQTVRASSDNATATRHARPEQKLPTQNNVIVQISIQSRSFHLIRICNHDSAVRLKIDIDSTPQCHNQPDNG